MKICILVFSPSGHTLKIGEELKLRLEREKHRVQLLNLSGEREKWEAEGLCDYLESRVDPHDILFMGSPVYAGHFESNGLKIIRNLPSVDNKWGRVAVPFISYGGIHSSVALKEAGRTLRRSGRKNAFGFKVRVFHTLTKTLPTPLNTGKPDSEDFLVLDKAVSRLNDLDQKRLRDKTSSFSYNGLKERILFTLLSQDYFHKKHRTTRVDKEACSGCGLCVRKCPVNAIVLKDGKAEVIHQERCILCAECFHSCSENAVEFPYIDVVKGRAGGKVPLEDPPCGIYPEVS